MCLRRNFLEVLALMMLSEMFMFEERQLDLVGKLQSLTSSLTMCQMRGVGLPSRRRLFLHNVDKFLFPLKLEVGLLL